MYTRRRLDKVLDRYDEDTPITNPKEPIRTFFRRLVYRLRVWRSKHERPAGPRSSSNETRDGRE
jgi:hypothetical protein